MSFIKIINSRGPRTDLCGTPYLIIFLDDRVLSIRVIISVPYSDIICKAIVKYNRNPLYDSY